MNHPIYLDYNATTPVDPAVCETMLPYFRENFGNSSSVSHQYGFIAEKAVMTARRQVADLIGAEAKEIIWTSGATESNNLAIKGIAEKYRDKGNHIITCQTEHKAVLDVCSYLELSGYEVTCLPVDSQGMIDPDQLRKSITDKTILISFMAANNETGVIHPIEEIGNIAHEKEVFFHCDATQAVGKIPIDVKSMNIDLLSLSAHKIYGPKGIGVLYVRDRNPRVRPAPIIHGGGHENDMRSGTLNVPGIAGIGRACEICKDTINHEPERLNNLAEKLYQGIISQLDHVILNGHPEKRLGHVLNLTFGYVEGEALMLAMPDVAVSSGSACTSASLETSYVLRAMGISDDYANSSLRFSLGRFTTEKEINSAIGCVASAVNRLREMSPLYEKIIQKHL